MKQLFLATSILLGFMILTMACSNSIKENKDNIPKNKTELISGYWSDKLNGTPTIKFTADTIDYTDTGIPYLGKHRYSLIDDTIIIEFPKFKSKFAILKLNTDTLIISSKEGCDTAFRVKP